MVGDVRSDVVEDGGSPGTGGVAGGGANRLLLLRRLHGLRRCNWVDLVDNVEWGVVEEDQR